MNAVKTQDGAAIKINGYDSMGYSCTVSHQLDITEATRLRDQLNTILREHRPPKKGWKKKQVGISDDGAAVYGETLVPASESNCGKVRYPDKKAAVSAINFRRQFRGAPQELRAYHCPDCGGWHMTKKP